MSGQKSAPNSTARKLRAGAALPAPPERKDFATSAKLLCSSSAAALNMTPEIAGWLLASTIDRAHRTSGTSSMRWMNSGLLIVALEEVVTSIVS